MKEKTKTYMYTTLLYVALIGFGMLYSVVLDKSSTQKGCNDFILETYVNIDYETCVQRCDAKNPKRAKLPYNLSLFTITEGGDS